MTSTLRLIVNSLADPDDQGDDWYAWATNQCGHFTIGAVLFGMAWFVGGSLVLAIMLSIVPGLIKEAADLKRSPRRWRDLRDCLRDVLFWSAGCFAVTAVAIGSSGLFVTTVASASGLLLAGVLSRARRQLDKKADVNITQ